MVCIDTMLLCFCVDVCCVVSCRVGQTISLYLSNLAHILAIHPSNPLTSTLPLPVSRLPMLWLQMFGLGFDAEKVGQQRQSRSRSVEGGGREGAWCRVGGGRMLTELRLMGCERVKVIQTLKQPLGQKHFYCARPVSCSRPVITLIMWSINTADCNWSHPQLCTSSKAWPSINFLSIILAC